MVNMIFFAIIGFATVILFVKFLMSETNDKSSISNVPVKKQEENTLTLEEVILVAKRREQQQKETERNYSLSLMAKRWECAVESLKEKFLNDLFASARLEEGVGYDLDLLKYADLKLVSSIDEECRVLKISRDVVPSAIMHSWVQKTIADIQETVDLSIKNSESYKAKKEASRMHRILSFAAISDSLECNPEDVEPLYKALMHCVMRNNLLSHNNRVAYLIQQREQHLQMINEEAETLAQVTDMLVNNNDTPGAIMAYWVLEVLSEVESDEEDVDEDDGYWY